MGVETKVTTERERVLALTAKGSVTLPDGKTCPYHGNDPAARLINELMGKGFAAPVIVAEVRSQGLKATEHYVYRHRRLCFKNPKGIDADAIEMDLATLVRDQTARGILSGRLEVSVKDGVMAQGLIDRRAEKVADRAFVLNLTRLLSGGGHAAPAELIEGEVIDVTPGVGLLAPPELRE